MKKIAVLPCLILMYGLDACAGIHIATISNTPDIAENGLELITDAGFTGGLATIPACKRPDSDVDCAAGIKYNIKSPQYPENASARPAWDLAQWGSRSNFKQTATAFGTAYAWSTDTKRLVIYPDGTIEMTVDGLKELDGKYLTDRTSWPSLIASQTIAAPGPYSRDISNIAEMTKLLFSLDFRLLYEDVVTRQGYDAERDALIFPINLTVQNLNRKNVGYGDYVWLQVTAYDDRHVAPNPDGEKNMIDLGTKKMIYFVPSDAVTQDNVHARLWSKFKGDLLPYARRAVQLAYNRGLLKSQDLRNYSIGGINIGYELTGLNKATFQFRHLSLKAFY